MGIGKQCRRCAALQELGLTHGANEKSIRSAYIGQVKAWHPDRHMKTKAQQLAADEKTKRINVAYKFLTAPSKKGDAPSSRRSTGTPASPSRTTHGTGDSQQPPKGSSATRTKRSRSSRQAVPSYPQRDFIAWKAAFDELPMGRTKAAEGLKKWINSEAAQRASTIAFLINSCKQYGIAPNLNGFARPEDARDDVMKRLWNGSVPNVKERTSAIDSDKRFIKKMDEMRESVVSFTEDIQRRSAQLPTQDGGFYLSLDNVRKSCIHLSALLSTASLLVKREYVQPVRLADCCTELVWHLEAMHGLSQAECHALIKCALLAYGCTKEQVTPFDTRSVKRGTIRAKKEALAKKILEGANVIAQVMQENKRQSVGSDAPMKKSPL